MLKNAGMRLPLGAPASYANTLVVGPNIDLSDMMVYYGGEAWCVT